MTIEVYKVISVTIVLIKPFCRVTFSSFFFFSFMSVKCWKAGTSAEHPNASREPQRCREKERERRRRRRWRLIEEKHEDYPRCLSEQAGRASRLPSRVRGRLEAEGGSGEEDRMEEKKQFLCGVVEGKSGRLHN